MYQEHNPIYSGPLPDFPEDLTLPAGAQEVAWKDTEQYRIDMHPDIVYAERDGMKLHLHLLVPTEGSPFTPQKKYPLIVFIQGSGWQKQQIFQKLGTFVRICEKGYAVAFVEYRPSDVAKFPAQVLDAKTAIRFLRRHADEYRLLTDDIALWGDSSGGHTALMTGITGDSYPDLPDEDGISCSVSCIVDWYGISDFLQMTEKPCVTDHGAPDSIEAMLLGCAIHDNPALAQTASPINYLSEEKDTPPILIIHGSKDHIVPFHQSVLLYNRLRELGKEVEFIKVKDAYHAFGGFHCDGAREASLRFIKKHIVKEG